MDYPIVILATTRGSSPYLPDKAMTESLSLDQLNALPAEELTTLLLRCCGSTEWVRRTLEQRPAKQPGGRVGRRAGRAAQRSPA